MGSIFSRHSDSEKSRHNKSVQLEVEGGKFGKAFLSMEGKLWRDESRPPNLKPILFYEEPPGRIILRNHLAKNMILGLGHSLLRFVEMTAEDVTKRAQSKLVDRKQAFEVLVQWALSFTFKVGKAVFDTEKEAALFCDMLAIPSLNRILTDNDPFFDFLEPNSNPSVKASMLLVRERSLDNNSALTQVEQFLHVAPEGWARYNMDMLVTLVTGKIRA